jgi:hypothetical protein
MISCLHPTADQTVSRAIGRIGVVFTSLTITIKPRRTNRSRRILYTVIGLFRAKRASPAQTSTNKQT